mmetsp:Transcript_20435/g.70568  ORF Transcript_20435/g.70568 Transcript_20435/m.70568 type:complete len:178 (+) Transcript_20435:67-600(+)
MAKKCAAAGLLACLATTSAFSAAFSAPKGLHGVGKGLRFEQLKRQASMQLAEDDAAPVTLVDSTNGRNIICFPGAYVKFDETDGPTDELFVVATPCDTPVAFAPSVNDDDDETTWEIVQDDDPQMEILFECARQIVEEYYDCQLVRSALFPTLEGDLESDDEDDDEDEDAERPRAMV